MGLESRLMSRFYDIDAANAAIPELDGIVAVLARAARRAGPPARRHPGRGIAAARARPPASRPRPDRARSPISSDLRLARLRMQGLIDQMAAGVARIDALGLTLRDIERGLVDFPALVSGRQIWLCWQPGETSIGWWHDLDTGFDGRRPLAELA